MRKFMRALMATAVVAVSCMAWTFGPTAGASARAWEDWVPSWASEAADEIINGCNTLASFPTSFLGTPTTGAMALPVSSATAASAPPTPWGYWQPLTATEGTWMSSPRASWQTSLRTALWEGSRPAATYSRGAVAVRAISSGTGTAVAVNGAAAAASGTSVATTASVHAGATATASQAGVVLSGSTVAIATVAAVGSFCGSIVVQDHFFGEKPVTPVPPGVTRSSGLIECSALTWSTGTPIAGADVGDKCLEVEWPGNTLPSPSWYSVVPYTGVHQSIGSTGTITTDAVPVPYSAGLNGSKLLAEVTTAGVDLAQMSMSGVNSRGHASHRRPTANYGQVVLPCASPEYFCGLFDQDTRNNVSTSAALAIRQTSPAGGLYASVVADRSVQALGKLRRLVGQTKCLRPTDDDEQVFNGYSEPFWDSVGKVRFEAPLCPVGYAPIQRVVWREIGTGGSTAPVSFAPGSVTDLVLDWTLPTATKNNDVTLACLVVGATDCARVPDPAAPSTNDLVGGPGGLTVDRTAPNAGEKLEDLLEDTPWPDTPYELAPDPFDGTEPEPDPDPDPGETTGADPRSGGTPGTSTPTGDPDEDACVPSGWGWLNPVEWVVKPLKCVLIWAFWDADAADEMGELWGDTGDPWVDTATGTAEGISFDPEAADACIPLDAEEICASHVLSIELPSSVSLLLTVVFTFAVVFEVIGLFARITGG